MLTPGVILPLNFQVATVTVRNEIRKPISFRMAIELVERDFVMYVKLFANFLLGNTTFLASVAISFSCPSPLSFPVRAVIVLALAAPPIKVVFPRVADVGAVERAESKPPSTLKGSGDSHMLSARFACKAGRLFCWRGRGNEAALSSGYITIPRANDNLFCSNLIGLAGKFFRTHFASQGNINLIVFTSKLIGTFSATRSLSTVLQSRFIGKIHLAAVRTLSFYHVHNYSMGVGQ